jgi:hypothetical protein
MKYFASNNIKKFYAYKQRPKDKRIIEFGWVPVRFLQDKICVVARSPSDPEQDNAASLEDYRKYFTKLSKSTPEEFVSKWSGKESEFSTYWYKEMSHTEPGTHEFILKLAELITNRKSFEHNFSKRLTHYEVVDVANEESNTPS